MRVGQFVQVPQTKMVDGIAREVFVNAIVTVVRRNDFVVKAVNGTFDGTNNRLALSVSDLGRTWKW